VLLFSESASRHLVTVRQGDRELFEEVMTGNCFSSIGMVVEDQTLTITGLDGSVVLRGELDELKEAWQSPLREM
jgi:phosphoribosylformylglycinamidine synthase